MTRYAETTTVSSSKSRAEIEATLERYGRHLRIHGKGGCWEWTGPRTINGYARMSLSKTRHCVAHRVIYELFRGPIPDGLDLDHLCRVRHCVNPAHLEPVTRRENVMRGESPKIKAHLAGRCVRGHEMTAQNTYISPKGVRQCRECNRIREARRSRNRVQDSDQ